MVSMTYHSIPADPLSDPWEGAPAYVRAAALRKARAFRVLRLYHRRGWNPTAVVTEYSRSTEELHTALTRWEHEEANPTLF